MADKFRTVELRISRCKLCDFPVDLPVSQDPFYDQLRRLMGDGLVSSEFTSECQYHTNGNEFVLNVIYAYNVQMVEDNEDPKETDDGLEPA